MVGDNSSVCDLRFKVITLKPTARECYYCPLLLSNELGAAPKARPVFIEAIKEMNIQDANRILNGGDTAATDYFRTKTSQHLAEAFKPEISSSMNKVGVARQYKALTERYFSLIPLAGMDSFDLDQYVTNKALEGLFHMLGQEEKKIRTNPAARTTEILKKVFGK